MPNDQRDLILLEQIEKDPDATQASLAQQLRVAIGTVNWHLRRLIEKGCIKVRRLQRRKLRYLITPDGIALRTRLTMDYIHTSFELYRLVRSRMNESLREVRKTGTRRIRLKGSGDVAEICRLTCLENGISIVEDPQALLLEIDGLKIFLRTKQDEQA